MSHHPWKIIVTAGVVRDKPYRFSDLRAAVQLQIDLGCASRLSGVFNRLRPSASQDYKSNVIVLTRTIIVCSLRDLLHLHHIARSTHCSLYEDRAPDTIQHLNAIRFKHPTTHQPVRGAICGNIKPLPRSPPVLSCCHQMAAETYMITSGQSQPSFSRISSSQAISPLTQPKPFDKDIATNLPIGTERMNGHTEPDVTAIFIRKLPPHTKIDTVRTMFLCAKDFLDVQFVPTEYFEENGYVTAQAHFRTLTAAQDARTLLHGKPSSSGEAPMSVELVRRSPQGSGLPSASALRRNTFDIGTNLNPASSSSSTASSSDQTTRQSSRFNGGFRTLPSNGTLGLSNGAPMGVRDLSGHEIIPSYQNPFPQSPIRSALEERQHISGKSVIGEDGIDDEPVDLLNDPVAYAQNESSGSMSQPVGYAQNDLSSPAYSHNELPMPMTQPSRRQTLPQIPTARFSSLTLNTSSVTAPPMQGFASPRSVAPMQSPTSAMSPTTIGSLGPNTSYQLTTQHYRQTTYPAVNPADQNPPCNTLYVGNLPIDTSEDELKAMFSKQRGYKRLCFRTKQNGPMCFVEFEDISFATKALHELYGHPLHNSVKGGIRLSFSKNPLGVRTVQPGGMGPSTPLSPQGPMPGLNGHGGMQGAFSTANGPPPGLAAPPGLSTNFAANNNNSASSYGNSVIGNGSMMSGGLGGGFSMGDMRSPQVSTNPWTTTQSGRCTDFTYGR